ncbi:MAG: hypothetical protein DWQ37_06395 [Planctomycetota bacterium]|nr:MAG: hypothetical protein DWQ37_06395 [Planctomycetota bacterium]
MNRLPQFHLLLLCVMAAAVVGCSEDSQVLSLRNRFVLKDEPPGAIAVSQATAETDDSGEVVVVGRIRADSFEPWADGMAAFVLSEALPDHGGAGHDAANCPFCKRRMKESADSLITVQFRGDDGQIIPIDARELFELEDNQAVVVRGRRSSERGILLLVANAIHVRR